MRSNDSLLRLWCAAHFTAISKIKKYSRRAKETEERGPSLESAIPGHCCRQAVAESSCEAFSSGKFEIYPD